MNGCMANPMTVQAPDPVIWLRLFILVQLHLGLIDARMAEVALMQVEQLRVAVQMAKLGQAMLAKPTQTHATLKAVPLPAAVGSKFMLHDHYAREGKPLGVESAADRRYRREVANWNERPVEELLAETRQRRAKRHSAAA